MPTKRYREDFLQRLADPEYSSLYVETALEETLKDGDVTAFLHALGSVLEASEIYDVPTTEPYISRQRVYEALLEEKNLTLDKAVSALGVVGIVPEAQPIEALVSN